MKVTNCKPGALVKPIKGDHGKIGVVQEVNGETAKVMLSKAGSDEVRNISIEDLNYPNVTEGWINEFVTLNS